MTPPAHFWESLPGFFTFPDFYSWLAEQVGDGAHLVEVGVYGGQSVAYLGVELLRRGKARCRIDGVDLFHGGVETVRAGLSPLGELVNELHVSDSAAAASRYEDGSLDAVFIDADHSYESVARDIDAWRPKVRLGGILAGHDFTLFDPGIIQAVTERFARWDVWRGRTDLGDEQMRGKAWPVWAVRL